jgi:putative endonuclease
VKQSTHSKGSRGERIAAAYLQERGYRIVAWNVRLPGGEIDLIALEGGALVFIEVKRRDTGSFGRALHAVDARKRATLRALAADYAQVLAPRAQIRFDVVTIDGKWIALHRNAF